jgi:hypothetical protein
MLNRPIDGPNATSLSEYKKTVMPSPCIPNPLSQSLSLLSIFLHPLGDAFSLSPLCACCYGGWMACCWWRCLLPLSSASAGGSTLELLQGGRIQQARLIPKWIRLVLNSSVKEICVLLYQSSSASAPARYQLYLPPPSLPPFDSLSESASPHVAIRFSLIGSS